MTSLNASLSIATSGLKATEYAMSVASQNIANASTSGYTAEVANVQSLDVAGTGMGVASGPTTLAGNAVLEKAVNTQNGIVGSWSAQSNALSAITALQGSTDATSGSSGTLADALGDVQTALISLTSTPSSASAQQTVIADAQTLVSTVNTLADAYQQQRQNAQDTIVSSVSTVNTDLTTIGSLSQQIMQLKAQGASTADLENQRTTVVSQLSSELGITTQETSDGDLVVKTASGVTLPTHDPNTDDTGGVSSTWPLSTSDATITAEATYPGTDDDTAIPGIYLNGQDVTSSLTGGTLGGNITLRDSTLPTMQAQLDSFSYALASRFDAQGMTLFTSGTSGTVPTDDATATTPDGIVGFAQDLSVSSAYTDDASLLVDGASDDTTAVQNVLDSGFAASGTAAPSTGLGADGTLSTGYDGGVGLVSLATTLTARQASVANTASDGLDNAQSAQTLLSTKLSDATGVSVDSEMSTIVTLQNAYAANAKVVSAAQTMFNALLSAIGS